MADKRELAISIPKSAITLFTPHLNLSIARPHVSLNDGVIHLDKQPLILEVTLDSHFTFALSSQSNPPPSSFYLSSLEPHPVSTFSESLLEPTELAEGNYSYLQRILNSIFFHL